MNYLPSNERAHEAADRAARHAASLPAEGNLHARAARETKVTRDQFDAPVDLTVAWSGALFTRVPVTPGITHHALNECITAARQRPMPAHVGALMISRRGLRARTTRVTRMADEVAAQRTGPAAATPHSAA